MGYAVIMPFCKYGYEAVCVLVCLRVRVRVVFMEMLVEGCVWVEFCLGSFLSLHEDVVYHMRKMVLASYIAN
jgi:hypothetical protein